jgi:hypothetical protein
VEELLAAGIDAEEHPVFSLPLILQFLLVVCIFFGVLSLSAWYGLKPIRSGDIGVADLFCLIPCLGRRFVWTMAFRLSVRLVVILSIPLI